MIEEMICLPAADGKAGDQAANRAGQSAAAPAEPAVVPSRQAARPGVQTWVFIGILLLVNGFIYAQTAGFDFILLDDTGYVRDNPFVRAGVTWRGLGWAFTTFERSNWHPLTWLSLMLDGQLYAGWAGGCHLTNALLHQLNCVLLFLWLRGATAPGAISFRQGEQQPRPGGGGFCWPAALVALGFAAHPLHVESVAWVTERKDVLSTFFLLLSLCAYTRYARKQGREDGGEQWRRTASFYYLLALGSLGLGLLAKPMLVSAPFLLLLLDVWPLGRIRFDGWPAIAISQSSKDRIVNRPPALRLLLWEKAPFLALTVASSIITCLAQRGAMVSLQSFPLRWRLVNAVCSGGEYLSKTLWPADLALPYHFTPEPSWWQFAAAAAALAVFTLLSALTWRSRPYVAVGWLWFIVALLPVIGLVQVGSQPLADRYTYVPHIGLFIMVSYLISNPAFPAPRRKWLLPTLIGCVVGLAVVSRAQTAFWRDSVTLFRHSLEVSGPHPAAYRLLGNGYLQAGNLAAAQACYETSLRLEPANPGDLARLAAVCLRQGRWEAAAAPLRQLVTTIPADWQSWNHLGFALAQLGESEAASAAYEQCLRLRPDHELARQRLTLLRQIQGEKAGTAIP